VDQADRACNIAQATQLLRFSAGRVAALLATPPLPTVISGHGAHFFFRGSGRIVPEVNANVEGDDEYS
jgi:hypothetical protein